jgi:hypothetical protein
LGGLHAASFPVKVKKKLRVVVRDTFEDPEDESPGCLLSQLDSLEKNEDGSSAACFRSPQIYGIASGVP